MNATSMMRLVTAQSTKLRLRKSESGMTGSVARRSTSTKATAEATHGANSPMISQLSQAYRAPPQALASTSEVTDRPNSAAPA